MTSEIKKGEDLTSPTHRRRSSFFSFRKSLYTPGKFLVVSFFTSLTMLAFPAGSVLAVTSTPPNYCTNAAYQMVSGWLANAKSAATSAGYSIPWTDSNSLGFMFPGSTTLVNLWIEAGTTTTSDHLYTDWNHTDNTTYYVGSTSSGWDKWILTTSNNGSTWTAGGHTTGLTNSSSVTANTKGAADSTAAPFCMIGAKDTVTHTSAFNGADFYIYLPASPGDTWAGANFGKYACGTGYVGDYWPYCYAGSTGGGGGGTTTIDTTGLSDVKWDTLHQYLHDKGVEAIAIGLVAFLAYELTKVFRWRW